MRTPRTPIGQVPGEGRLLENQVAQLPGPSGALTSSPWTPPSTSTSPCPAARPSSPPCPAPPCWPRTSSWRSFSWARRRARWSGPSAPAGSSCPPPSAWPATWPPSAASADGRNRHHAKKRKGQQRRMCYPEPRYPGATGEISAVPRRAEQPGTLEIGHGGTPVRHLATGPAARGEFGPSRRGHHRTAARPRPALPQKPPPNRSTSPSGTARLHDRSRGPTPAPQASCSSPTAGSTAYPTSPASPPPRSRPSRPARRARNTPQPPPDRRSPATAPAPKHTQNPCPATTPTGHDTPDNPDPPLRPGSKKH